MEYLHCQSVIAVGRKYRKFCSDACKNEYHNNERFLENGETQRIVNALKQNRRIIKFLLGNREELYVPREALSKKGFDFDCHTHRIVSGQGNTFILCFNYGYRMTDEGRLKIVKWRRD